MDGHQCDADFDRSSELVRHLRNAHGVGALVRSMPLVLTHAPSVARLLRGIPKVSLCLTDEPAGLRIAARQGRLLSRPWRRYGRAVLAIPEDVDSYLRGRSRHALRNNLHRAAAAGLTCAAAAPEDIPEAVRSVLRARGELDEADVVRRCRCVTDVFTLVDRSGVAVAIVALDVDAHCAALELMRQAPSAASRGGRFLLHTHVVHEIAGRGVQWLLADSALQLGPGQQYFQGRVGYKPMNLRLRIARSQGSSPTDSR